MDDVVAMIRQELRLGYATAMGVPLSAIDGRPWVPTHEEEHPAIVWGDGQGAGCGHTDCGGTADGRNLVGILNHV